MTDDPRARSRARPAAPADPPAPDPERPVTPADVAPEPEPPPYAFIADAPLFIGDPESGAMPARAYNPGDRVLPADVERNGWHDLVHAPEE